MFKFLSVGQAMTFEYLFEGTYGTYPVDKMIYGWETELSDKINTGKLLKGNLYIDNIVTPISNMWKGPTANRRWTLMTGDKDYTLAAVIHNVDDDGMYLWLNYETWTGTEWAPTLWQND
jgi:hypothetical protein